MEHFIPPFLFAHFYILSFFGNCSLCTQTVRVNLKLNFLRTVTFTLSYRLSAEPFEVACHF
jgi:hypothetical protein